jgi:uncharacterized protein YjhX (UPF0386 family)
MAENIAKQLKSLKEVVPNAEWKKTNRDFLMSEISKKDQVILTNKTWASEISGIIFPWKVMKLAARPVFSLVAIIGLLFSGGLSVSASQMALPGDRLYPLKLATEKVRVALIFDKKEAAKKHIEFASKRINELKVIRLNSDSPEKKAQKINVAIDKFQEEIAVVGSKLDNLKNEVTPEATVEVAKIVDSKVNEYKETLTKATNDLPAVGETAEKISAGADLAEETGDKALAVIVEKHVQGEVVQPEEEVLERVEQKIEIAEAKVAAVEGQIDSLSTGQIEQIQQAAEEVKTVLVEAREALNQKDVTIALTKTMESKELVKQVEQMAIKVALTEPPSALPETNTNTETNLNTNIDLTNTADPGINTNTNTNTNGETNANTNTVKVYYPKQAVVAPAPPPEPEIDESEMVVGIDLRQEETQE